MATLAATDRNKCNPRQMFAPHKATHGTEARCLPAWGLTMPDDIDAITERAVQYLGNHDGSQSGVLI